jgi:dimethylhistidine N-methyltransferase/ergothioneine biosynthesis protein EgtC
MCRHLAYLGAPTPLASVLLEPEHSLYRQSWAPRLQRHGTVNADGYGFGWYPGAGDPGTAAEDTCFRHRRAVPIWADPNLPDLARALRSHAFLAAVRSATAGTTQDESAAAPFREGRWLFSHNGAVPDWTRLPTAGTGLDTADLLSLEARSDSALLWAMLARRLRQGEPPGLALAGVVRRVAEARPGARLNLLLTDGRTIAATRHGDTLWYRRAQDHVLVASEPHDDSDWEEVPDHTLLLASPDEVRSYPLRPVPRHSAQSHSHSKDENVNDRFSIEPRLPSDYFATTLRADVRQGLAAQPKTLPPKWFYDELGSKLFEQITELPEYYPTRAEQEILLKRAPEIAAITKARSLVELGSGSSRKTRLLLDALTAQGTLQRYSPLDVSASALVEAGEALCRDYPALRVTAAVTDFEHDLPLHDEPGPRLLAFLGSTIGNLDPAQRTDFFALLRRALSADDVLLLGADLVKDPAVLVAAYDDSQGVTEAFNKNVLQVLNRELDADFDADAFEHRAVWNAEQDRIEMHLVSRAEQCVKIPAVDLSVAFAAGESLRTEISTKFRRETLSVELAAAGFTVRRWWTDSAVRFALLLAVPSK